jgi:molecular chaperone HtpG
MGRSVLDTALLRRLATLDVPHLVGRITDLRSSIEDWLSYIPHTFPHYTRHTVRHSDEIVRQLSLLLFEDGDPARPQLALSPYEIYVLVTAAYFHDAGMVASDTEKREIILSDAWQEWTTSGAGAARWAEIDHLRAGVRDSRHDNQFLADIQTRYLLAEFIRKQHHLRAATVVTTYAPLLNGYADGNETLARTISEVCVGHGIDWRELEDRERYPLRRDIDSEPVNVRLITMLLRIGDLLDLSSDRACPMLLNAASPVPVDSYAHWTQYQRIVHRVTSPDTIEIIAECENQEEHRLLQDWCGWIAAEVSRVPLLLIGDTRHGRWTPPAARLQERAEDHRATIIVRPSPRATYLPVQWTFELDPDTVIQRLINDLHRDPLTFVRELLQNSLDASRCSLAQHLKAIGVPPTEWPGDAPEDVRARWPVTIALRDDEMPDAISGGTEPCQILTVEDNGIGMTIETIQRYLLQVGRSFYTSPEFRRTYSFAPISQFGIGFLSVFSVSDRIVVDTLSDQPGSEAIRVTLTGPRNYLVVERSPRTRPGTTVTVQVRGLIAPGRLTTMISQWCRRVEFPIMLDLPAGHRSVVPETPAEFEVEHEVDPAFSHIARYLRVKAVPVNGRTVRGELYVFEHEDANGLPRWDRSAYGYHEYSNQHAGAVIPHPPEGRVFFNGMSVVRPASA